MSQGRVAFITQHALQSVKKAANRQNVNKQIDVAGKAFPCRGRRPRRPTHLPPWGKKSLIFDG